MHESKELIFDGIKVNIIFKNNKHSYLKLDKYGSVQLVVPYNITLTSIQTILTKKISRLKPQIDKLIAKRDNHQLYYLGDELNDKVIGNFINTKTELIKWYQVKSVDVFNER